MVWTSGARSRVDPSLSSQATRSHAAPSHPAAARAAVSGAAASHAATRADASHAAARAAATPANATPANATRAAPTRATPTPANASHAAAPTRAAARATATRAAASAPASAAPSAAATPRLHRRMLHGATRVSDRVLASFPSRVWQRFSRRNGLLLAAGTSDQAVFAVFAALYVAFAVVGIWLGSSRAAIDGLLAMVDGYAPGLISFDGGPGLVADATIRSVASDSAALLGITGIAAVLLLAWTAVGWVTFLRSSVRDMFELPPVDAHFALVKVWDFVAAVLFALLLFVGGTLSTIGTSALSLAFTVLGLSDATVPADLAGRVVSIAVAFLVDVIVLVSLYRFLAGTDLPLRRVLLGSLAAGGGLVVLQLLAGWVIGRVPMNPLVTTIALLLGVLVWFRVATIVILLGASWVAEAAESSDVAIIAESEHDRRVTEARTLVTAASVRLREARLHRGEATWIGRGSAIRAVRRAREELEAAEARLRLAEAVRDQAHVQARRWWHLRTPTG